MSGVITEDGQWEHCNGCGLMVNMYDLVYIGKELGLDEDLDLCSKCEVMLATDMGFFLHMKKALKSSWEHGKKVGADEERQKFKSEVNGIMERYKERFGN